MSSSHIKLKAKIIEKTLTLTVRATILCPNVQKSTRQAHEPCWSIRQCGSPFYHTLWGCRRGRVPRHSKVSCGQGITWREGTGSDNTSEIWTVNYDSEVWTTTANYDSELRQMTQNIRINNSLKGLNIIITKLSRGAIFFSTITSVFNSIYPRYSHWQLTLLNDKIILIILV